MRKSVRIAAWIAGILLLSVAIGWLIFVPGRKEPPYRLIASWGEEGSAPGQFRDPTGIAVAGDEVFVADARNGRIQVFDRNGRFKRAFGKPGEAPGELGRPMNLEIEGGKLYVPEYFNDRIQVFSMDGTLLAAFGGPGDGTGAFRSPGGVGVSRAGEIYVAEFMGHRVQKLGPEGRFQRQWGSGEPSRARGEFTYPADVAIADDGTAFVADGYAHRIQAIAPGGEVVAAWGGLVGLGIPGPFLGWFNAATSIAIGPEGNLFVVDSYNGRVQKFTPEGEFLTSFGEDELGHPVAVAAAGDGAVFVTDLLGQRVTKWRPPETAPAGS